MRAVTALCAAVAALGFALSACAGGKSASAPSATVGEADSALIDSLDASAYEDLFAAKHAQLMKEIQERRESGNPETFVLEALSLAAASEEMYLRGRLDLAVKLLDEASRNLEQKH
jgi:hypothetical protein